MVDNLTPAKRLRGRLLGGGWKVLEPIEMPSFATGGHFSQCYLVESAEGTKAFLKALDYSKALDSPDPARALESMTVAYNFERDLLAKCQERGMDRVVRSLGDGSIRVEETAAGVVQYLIFELADRDIRSHLALVGQIDVAWKLRCLHHMATGVWQLHGARIAHQDLKPSNVLVFEQRISKVADLGRASYQGHGGPSDEHDCAGDLGYAPPELLYRYIDPDWTRRRIGCDAYLLGSMVVFLFTGLSTTSMLMNELHESHRWQSWAGSFDEVLPYIRDAFGVVLEIFARHVTEGPLQPELRTIVSQLCEPDPRHRGDPDRRWSIGSRLSLERYVSKFDLLARRAELGFFRGQ